MSSNSEETGKGSGSNAQQAPRLLLGGYAAWRPSIDVFLQRGGAEALHKKALTEKEWTARSALVDAWADEAEADAWALLSPSTSSASSSTDTLNKREPVSEEVKAARKVASAFVERSRRVYGVIYSALPEELRTQVAHLSQGWAYGLWHWLECKFQSTEDDSVDDLLLEWSQLRQTDEESFDTWRARVNKLATLLEQAKEKPSARVYAFTLLRKLRPSYKLAVLESICKHRQLQTHCQNDFQPVRRTHAS